MSRVKKKTTTKRKTATKTTRKKSTRRGKSWERQRYTYNTPISVVEKDYKFDSGESPDAKIGDVFKKRGLHSFAMLLGG